MRKAVYGLVGALVGILFAIILITNTSKIKATEFDSDIGVNDSEVQDVTVTENSFLTEQIQKLEAFMNSLEQKEGYFVNDKKLAQYVGSNVVKFGRKDPMLYEKLEVQVEEEDISEFEPGETDDYVMEDGRHAGYNVAENKLVAIDIDEVERVLRNGALPVDSKYYGITSPFGLRNDPIDKDTRFHVGLDIAKAGINGQRIYAVSDGKVEIMSSGGGYGNYVVIDHGEFKTVYAHMEGFARGLKKGDTVEKEDTIGYVGSTGRSTGPHLHFEVEKDGVKLNPEHFISIMKESGLEREIEKIIEDVVEKDIENNIEKDKGGN